MQKTPTIDKISELYGWLKEEHISLYSTQRAYILRNELADLEQALVQYTLKYLKAKVTTKTFQYNFGFTWLIFIVCFNLKGFVFVSVPDILHHSIIVTIIWLIIRTWNLASYICFIWKESCGFQTKGFRNQVYKIDHFNEYGKYCLSGTAEMSLAGLLKNKVFNESELPLK